MKREIGQGAIVVILAVVIALIIGGVAGYSLKPVETVEIIVYEVPWENLPEMTMVYGLKDPPITGIFTWDGAVAFKEYVEDATHGKLTVELHPGGELGGGVELMEMVAAGTIQGCMNGVGTLMMEDPNLTVVHTPYLFRSLDHGQRTFDIHRGFGKKLADDFLEKTGVRMLGLTGFGFRNFTANKPLHGPTDFEGLVFRTMGTPSVMKIVERMGGTPTAMDMSEVYEALKTGVLDGEENPMWVVDLLSIDEVQSWTTLDGHVYDACAWTVNEEWFQSLPQPYKDVLLRGGEIYSTRASMAVRAALEMAKEHSEAAGMQFYKPTSEELMVYKERCIAPVAEYVRNEVVDDPKWFDEMVQSSLEALVDLNYVPDIDTARATLPEEVLELVG